MFYWLISLVLIVGAGQGMAELTAQKSVNTSCMASLQQKTIYIGLSSDEEPKVYSEGERVGSKLLHLTSEEYRNMIAENQFDPDMIILIEQLPLDIDLPLVAGVIVSQPLGVEGTHIQFMAQNLGIPIVQSKSFFGEKQDLEMLFRTEQQIKMICNSLDCRLEVGNSFRIKSPLVSVLPTIYDRRRAEVFGLESVQTRPKELLGGKFMELAKVAQKDLSLTPDISAIGPGYYEFFLDEYEHDGQSLRKIIKQHLMSPANQKVSASFSKEMLLEKLSLIQNSILLARPKNEAYQNIFQRMSEKLVAKYGIEARKFSIRSNNDVEDLLGAGLYESGIAKNLSAEELSLVIRPIWASLFNYRTFNIRRFLGQQEQNLSMPLMIHPLTEGDVLHATGILSVDNEGALTLDLNGVSGGGVATNPSELDSVVSVKIRQSTKSTLRNPWRKPRITIASGEKLVSKKMQKAFQEFFVRLQNISQDDFNFRAYPIKDIRIEFVITNNSEKPKTLSGVLLQYNPILTQEVRLGVLMGQIFLEDASAIQAEEELKSGADYSEFCEKSKLIPIEKLQVSDGSVRYALITYQGRPKVVFWRQLDHREMENKINSLKQDANWLAAGMIKLKEDRSTGEKYVALATYEFSKAKEYLGDYKKAIVSAANSMFTGSDRSFINVDGRYYLEEIHPDGPPQKEALF